jgi:hypothetical protein
MLYETFNSLKESLGEDYSELDCNALQNGTVK